MGQSLERHRPQCWIESRARERQPGNSLQQCSPAGDSGFQVGVSCQGPGEACPRLRADLISWGAKPHAPGTESGWGEVSTILCLVQRESLRRDSYGTLSPGAGAASRSRPRGSSVLPVLSPQEACLQSPAAHSTETSPPYPGGVWGLHLRGVLQHRVRSSHFEPGLGVWGISGKDFIHILRWEGVRMSNSSTSQVISVQLKGQLLFGPSKSLPGPAPSL